MTSFLLSPNEVRELTGSPQRARQQRWFQDHGIKADVGLDGRVKVVRAVYEARMMAKGRTTAKTEPDLGLLLRKTG